MPQKALRILIADPQHFHRMTLERSFNRLGYFRIAPVRNLAELLTLVERDCGAFDVVAANAGLAAGSMDLADFLCGNPRVRHALVYNAPASTVAGFACKPIGISEAQLPDIHRIERLMAQIEGAVGQAVGV
ncbi:MULTISPECIES: hypothetical protein [unclassified Pseudomonas]|uniref:hypothetical protein n=1 Tax=unclassified Pseudomonas TaxID=196821 RepID=UPI000A1E46DD|nr:MULTISPECIES: hypothetical protein [unclassified Pseudomonas]